ncbi:MAG: AAA family ATPase [Deltaproteobacteria bacterium]|nr:AAA family ATPase [Deltaproteobacteria bacterium]
MYTQFYGLREKPFTLSPDPKYLFLSDSHREALAHLLYGIEQGEGFIAVTGEVGTGKTTLCRTLLDRLDPSTEVAFVFNPPLSGMELLQAIHHELGLLGGEATRQELTEELNQFLLEKKAQGRRVLLIIDEAQNLERDALEQVRLLGNLETSTAKLIQIILLGQPELDAKLESTDLRQLRQRITVRWRLAPLNAAETREYVTHRLKVAGAARELFTELATREVHRRSRGIPRVINLLCDRALLAGFAAQSQSIGLGLVSQVEKEIAGPPKGGSYFASWRDRFVVRPDLLVAALVGAAAVALALGIALSAGWLRGDAKEAPPDVAAGAREERVAEPRRALELPEVSSPPPAEPRVNLAEALARLSPAATGAASFDALLEAWGEPRAGADVLSIGQVQDQLRARWFSVIALVSSDLDALRKIDRPALLMLKALDGAARPVLLERIDADSARLRGLAFEGSASVPLSDLAAHWDRTAYVAWRNSAQLPELLVRGEQTEAVIWLQNALTQLGLFAGGATGRFDAETARAVRAFQRAQGIAPDAAVGPFTQLMLYGALPESGAPSPRLAEPAA